MRSALLCALLAVAMVGFATTAGAYDILYTGDGAATHPAGGFGLSAAMWYFMADEAYDIEGEAVDLGGDWTAMHFPIGLYYGVADPFELGVKTSFQVLKAEPAGEGEDLEGSGLGDTWIYAKYMFMPEPMLTARVGWKINTGSTPVDWAGGLFGLNEDGDLATGGGQMDVDGALMLGMPAGPGVFDVALGYRYRMQNEDALWKPGDEFHFFANYGYVMSEALVLNIASDGYFGSDGEYDGEAIDDSGSSVVFINPGLEYMMESGLSLGADFHYPLMGDNVLKEWGLGLYLGWGQ